ncbi:hypothetical protein BaRGS_00038891 [Batillaria attramentaria]|uniref:LRAT domain-containing protein n=1 Tax=Batillaria attramentaria TaxID=370345 RepID=A0ABD0J578_9CAEN
MLTALGVFSPAEQLVSRDCCIAGDLLEIDRILYAHWAVYLGDGEVVHLSDPVRGRAVVERCRLEAAAQDCLVRINNKEVPAKERGLTPLPREEVIANAVNAIGKTVRYNIVIRNSEHFVTQLKYGVGWSDQPSDLEIVALMRYSIDGVCASVGVPGQGNARLNGLAVSDPVQSATGGEGSRRHLE